MVIIFSSSQPVKYHVLPLRSFLSLWYFLSFWYFLSLIVLILYFNHFYLFDIFDHLDPSVFCDLFLHFMINLRFRISVPVFEGSVYARLFDSSCQAWPKMQKSMMKQNKIIGVLNIQFHLLASTFFLLHHLF